MPMYEVSLYREVRQATVICVEADNPAAAEEAAIAQADAGGVEWDREDEEQAAICIQHCQEATGA